MSIKEKNLKILEEFENLEGKIIVQVNDEIASEISIEKNEESDYFCMIIYGISYDITRLFKNGKKVDIKLMKKTNNGLKLIEFKKINISGVYEDKEGYRENNDITFFIEIDEKEFKVFNFETAIKEE